MVKRQILGKTLDRGDGSLIQLGRIKGNRPLIHRRSGL